ncbi:MAG: response regulator transcription factor [Rhodoferax sp.]|nr:response regulator transcription factor [Rhodoferax sp.]
MKLRVMLADDHTLFREALRMVLELEPDIEVVAEAENGHRVFECIDQARPDVVCMDLNMPGLDGVETTRRVLSSHPQVKVIALSAHVDRHRVAEMFRAGALGYVVKGSAGVELLAAIRAVRLSRNYFSPELGIKGVADLAISHELGNNRRHATGPVTASADVAGCVQQRYAA